MMLQLIALLVVISSAVGFQSNVVRRFATNRKSLSMLTVQQEVVTLDTPTGPMKTTILRPSSPGKYPGIVFYSEIFQLTGPIMRTAQVLAGHGFVVAVPEIYHATSSGWVGEYTTEGADEGNRLKVATPAESHDTDSAAILSYLKSHPACTGKLGTAGFCIGGHLSLRAAMMNDGVSAVASWYPTDMHTGDGVCAGLIDRSKDTFNMFSKFTTNNGGDGTEVLMIYGKQDRHVDGDGRSRTYKLMTDAGVHFEWLEFNGMHAFMRDEGYRYDPQLEMFTMQYAISMFQRKLHLGDTGIYLYI
jgi:carboxymethylenebutenolidase